MFSHFLFLSNDQKIIFCLACRYGKKLNQQRSTYMVTNKQSSNSYVFVSQAAAKRNGARPKRNPALNIRILYFQSLMEFLDRKKNLDT